MAVNVFYRLPHNLGTKVITLPKNVADIDHFEEVLCRRELLAWEDYNLMIRNRCYRSGRNRIESIPLYDNETVDILIPLPGGKGGFGSLLRAIGAQIEKTTNRDACRDLSGRRLRDVKREDELKKLLALQAKLIEEKKRRKREKIEKLKKKQELSNASVSIQELVSMFDDQAYSRRRLEIGDIIDAAMEKGIINFKKRQLEEIEAASSSKKTKLNEQEETGCSSYIGQEAESREATGCAEHKRPLKKTESDQNPKLKRKAKKKDLWLGLDDIDDDEDEDDSDK